MVILFFLHVNIHGDNDPQALATYLFISIFRLHVFLLLFRNGS